jgi:predicted site-specific integrase-resolvase
VRVDVLDTEGVSPEQELSDDLLNIVQIFCCRRNGRRRYRNASSPSGEEDQDESDQGAKGEAE